MKLKAVCLALVTSLVAGMVGCTVGIGGSGSGAGQTVTKITVTPVGIGIPVGASQQFSATATLTDGTTRNLSTKVTWTASPSGLVTIDTTGKATAVATGDVTIKATFDSITGTAAATVNPPVLVSVAITPLGAAVETGATLQLSATGIFSDGNTVDVTSTADWVSSVPGAATVSSGLVTAVATGQSTITATSNSFIGTSALNVIAPPTVPPVLNGDYAFSFTGVDARGPQQFVGTFHANAPDANGNGTIDSGEEDANTSTGITNSILTGTYSIFPDGRGTIVLTPSGLAATTFRFILASDQTTGLAIEFDGSGTAAGSFELQDSGAFNDAGLSGNYVFRFTGIDSVGKPLGEVGVFAADGAGAITGGTADQSDFGVPAIIPTLSGAYSVASNGRATLALTGAGTTSNFVAYLVSASKLRFVQVDAAPNSLLAGQAENQATGTFSNSSLSGGYAYLLDRAPSKNLGTFDVVGRASFDNHGGISGGTQEETGGVSENDIQSGSYNIAANGRGVITANTDQGNRVYTVYMVSPDRMFMLDNFTPWAGTGAADKQSPNLVNATLTGPYGLAGASIGQNDTELTMWLNADGNGGMAGVADLVQGGVPSSVIVNATYIVTPNGRTSILLANPPVGVESFIVYVVSADKADILGVQPALDGFLLSQ